MLFTVFYVLHHQIFAIISHYIRFSHGFRELSDTSMLVTVIQVLLDRIFANMAHHSRLFSHGFSRVF